ncbi:OsmC family protein [Nemorincola caseinilytica]|uniref:OsmC family protein n=1 Tax=Nemorincola caseinilytica TaxID=2054315 RepID=A0ABP8NLD8_9BACT
MNGTHHYKLTVEWTGNNGTGTSNARAYERSHTLVADGKEPLPCSSDPAFRGDPTKYNPEDMLVYALSSCHMLWYLHLCADAGIVITSYVDHPEGTMVEEHGDEKGRFTEVTLHPIITITDGSKQALAESLHEQAHHKCFIANSCNFPVHHKPRFIIQAAYAQ